MHFVCLFVPHLVNQHIDNLFSLRSANIGKHIASQEARHCAFLLSLHLLQVDNKLIDWLIDWLMMIIHLPAADGSVAQCNYYYYSTRWIDCVLQSCPEWQITRATSRHCVLPCKMFDEIFQLVSSANVSTSLHVLHKHAQSAFAYKLFTLHIVSFTLPYIHMFGWNILHVEAYNWHIWQAS